jgi:hypothetical protein
LLLYFFEWPFINNISLSGEKIDKRLSYKKMEILIKINDATASASEIAFTLATTQDTLTIEALITEKVRHEVSEFNRKIEQSVKTIGELNDTEVALNQKVTRLRLQSEDFEKQCYIALEGFTKNRFFVFVNDQQYFHLHDAIPVEPTMEVLFIKLTPLVGG